MNKWIFRLLLLALLPAGAVAQDMGKLAEAVDKEKAADSVDVEKVKEAMSTPE
jgi:hypothetical protein